MYVYSLFCMANRCGTVARFIRATTPYSVIQPTYSQRKWIEGVPHEVERDFLPGYLFLYSEEAIPQLLRFLRIDGVVRILAYGRDEQGSPQFELTGGDLDFAMGLYRCGGRINAVKVYREGDRLRLSSGLLEGKEGEILKVDHQRKRLKMQFSFEGISRTIWVGYDVIEAPAEGFSVPKD